MSNLENMTKKILGDGRKEATKIKEKSDKDNQELINSRIAKANEKKQEIIDQAKTEAAMYKNRLKSETQLQVRDKKLAAKGKVLDQAFDLAKKSLKEINEDEYIVFLKQKLEELNLKGNEIIVVPDNFKNLIKTSGLSLNVSEEESVESGFIVKDGNISVNYSFDSLVDFVRDDLEGEVAKKLFEGKE